jgi:hypothetical protein
MQLELQASYALLVGLSMGCGVLLGNQVRQTQATKPGKTSLELFITFRSTKKKRPEALNSLNSFS